MFIFLSTMKALKTQRSGPLLRATNNSKSNSDSALTKCADIYYYWYTWQWLPLLIRDCPVTNASPIRGAPRVVLFCIAFLALPLHKYFNI